jgi:anaerobic selenocysteine-containing dehydrogenase
MSTKTFRTCTLCEAMCGIVVENEGERVLSIRGDDADPFSRGHICPKAVGLKDLHEDPDRLRRPLIREGEKRREVDWDEAFDVVARQLRSVQRAHGKSSVAVYQGNPTVHNYGTLMYAPRVVRALRTKSRFSATSVDQLPHQFTSYLMFGHQALLPVPDIDRTDYLLMLGANPAVSNGSLMSAPGVSDRLRAIKERGKVVIVDPRRSESAELGSEHLFVRPGSDALLLLSMLHVIFGEGRERLRELASWVDGVQAIRELVEPYAPGRVSAAVGISPAEIRRLAREFSAAERAVCYGRIGVSTQRFGALACWLINVLNIVTGNFDTPGGAMFTTPAVDLVKPPFAKGVGRGHFAKWKTRVRGLPEFGGELPVATLAEEMDTAGPGQIRALVTSCGNPVLSTPNGARLERALASLDFMVSIDFYLNETTRHAHVILPPSGPLEHDHYDLVFHSLAVRNTTKYAPAVFARSEAARHDWEIWNELAWRLEERPVQRLAERATSLALAKLGPRGLLDVLLRTGPRGDRFGLRPGGLSLAALEREPHGIDLGALEPCLRGRLFTNGQKVELAPELLVRDVERLERELPALSRTDGPLVLIGRRQLRSNNSWMHNSQRLVKGPVRCTLEMNPADAAALGVRAGQEVELSSRVGKVVAPVKLSTDLMPGVVSLPHGWGHHRPGTQLKVAGAHAGVSINDVTDELAIDELCGNAGFSGLSVRVVPLTVSAAPSLEKSQ